MKLTEYLVKNKVHVSLQPILNKEFSLLNIVDMSKVPDNVIIKLKTRIEELTMTTILNDFYAVSEQEGEIYRIPMPFENCPEYIDTYRFGKRFILKREGGELVGCFYTII